MAQIEQSDGGKKKKGAQKKMHIHVDFTPMVDMNMLLITFFMLCTTMIKSQTLKIALPANKDPNEQQQQDEPQGDVAGADVAFLMILDTERDDNGNIKYDGNGRPLNYIYYAGYTENPATKEVTQDPIERETFVGNAEGKEQGIRAILAKRNKELLEAIRQQKKDYDAGKITKEEYDSIVRILASDQEQFPKRPKVNIKASPSASWETVVSALDEMQINGITQWRLAEFTDEDQAQIDEYKKNNPDK